MTARTGLTPQAIGARAAALVIALAAAGAPFTVRADEAPAASGTAEGGWALAVGVKAWAARWATWEVLRADTGGRVVEFVSQRESGTRAAWVPVVGVRHGRLFGTASFLSRTAYDLSGARRVLTYTREEVDANLGWDLSDNLALSMGFKRIVQDGGGRYLWRGPVLGLAARAPMGEAWSMYGTLGQGWLRLRLPLADAAGQTTLSAPYALGEWGLAWRPGTGGRSVLTLGYRMQIVRTQAYALGERGGDGVLIGPAGRATLRDVTEGWSLAWAYSY